METVYKVVAYKVVTTEKFPMEMSDFFYSVFAENQWCVRYKLHVESVAQQGLFFCFATKEKATDYALQFGTLHTLLLECETPECIPGENIANGKIPSNAVDWESFWKAVDSNESVDRLPFPRHLDILPKGTVFCRTLTPLKIIRFSR